MGFILTMNTPYKHIEANIYSHKIWDSCTVPKVLKTRYERLLKEAGFTIILFNEHHFDKQGYTCFWLLGESHLAIHTFPESGKSYIELSSCSKEKLDLFINKMNQTNA
ncbi:spermidine synthase [Tenacibaculum finnmarkense]|uniref:Adenosylmethionine decarboxylase n=2 Tax=Tenacibaculum finnmarkense TaxID=2781243 RepID=A0A2I2M967_9FLAO|nr:spermidine synthase [Tenacibaculum finnmarkense genomovar ulcerans]MCG8732502.1 spermidine synthase [Tenacibaculum finnmarkense]MBE7697218.1 spermidine synthase [Tenacibaculum finnmarkense genomovar ulcerans]MCG8795219.1 spermidine synthase [Tenacibaculum finnmarkense]MCG8797546.1 spermidine synthase [Tenacibaculum finnmarkense]